MSDLPSFDNMRALHNKDPQAFEALRTQLVNDYIHSIPSQRRTRVKGLQFKIDARRQMASTPMAACIELSNMMHETFLEMNYSLHGFSDATENTEFFNSEPEQQSAQIIPFRREVKQ